MYFNTIKSNIKYNTMCNTYITKKQHQIYTQLLVLNFFHHA